MKFALSIAASDPSGGAGIEADLKVFAGLRVFGLTAITALTVQGPKGVEKLIPTPPKEFARILKILKNDLKISAVKIGALVSAQHLNAVKFFLKEIKAHSVLDPILNSATGFPLLEEKAQSQLISLFSLVSLITPNLPEAEALSGIKLKASSDLIKIAERLAEKGAKAILIKGGHFKKAPEDFFWQGGNFYQFKKKRIKARFHGTGCALSSAIAGYLALGYNLKDAVAKAESYLEQALLNSVKIGKIRYLTHSFLK